MEDVLQVSRERARDVVVPWRAVAFGTLLVVYVLLTVGVVHTSPLLKLDSDVLRWNLRQHSPGWFPVVQTWVTLGQRGPATIVALPWFAWRAWKSQSIRPILMLVTALLLLNLSVGVVKLATGRLGPLRSPVNVHAVFHDGSVFPSGHTSNAVVLYGVIAMLVVTHRRTVAAIAVFVSLTVGASTIYLDTHWLTDVIGGWLAGGLVLLTLPTVMPYAERAVAALARALRRRRGGGPHEPAHAAVPPPPRLDDPLTEPARVAEPAFTTSVPSAERAKITPSGQVKV